jgi:hypothetical protein
MSERPEPVHAIEKDRAMPLIGKSVLFANEKEGLGTYGTLLGWSKRGYFIVEPDHAKGKHSRCQWIIEYTVRT